MRYAEDIVRFAALFLAVAGVSGAAIALLLWVSLRPPRLVVPEPGFELAPVTVVQPGQGALAGRRVVVRGDRIERIGRRRS